MKQRATHETFTEILEKKKRGEKHTTHMQLYGLAKTKNIASFKTMYVGMCMGARENKMRMMMHSTGMESVASFLLSPMATFSRSFS